MNKDISEIFQELINKVNEESGESYSEIVFEPNNPLKLAVLNSKFDSIKIFKQNPKMIVFSLQNGEIVLRS